MADRFWVQGTGSWSDDDNHWSDSSGGSPSDGFLPGTGDRVFFDVNSFSSSGQIVTIDVAATCEYMDWTGAANTPTLAGSQSLTFSSPLSFLSIVFISAMTVTFTGAISIEGNGNGTFIDTQGKVLSGGLSYTSGSAVGETVRLDSNLNLGSGDLIVSATGVNNYSLDLNGKTLTCGSFNLNSETASSFYCYAATINCSNVVFSDYFDIYLGSSTWNLSATSGSSWSISNTFSNITLDAGTSTINVNGSSIFDGGGLTYKTVVLSGTIVEVQSSNTFSTLTISAGITVKFTSGTTQTVTTFNAIGTLGNLITIQSTTDNSAHILSKASGTVNTDYISIKDSTATGGATWIAGGTSYDMGGNTGWVFNATTTSTSTTSTSSSTSSSTTSSTSTTTTSTSVAFLKFSIDTGEVLQLDVRIVK